MSSRRLERRSPLYRFGIRWTVAACCVLLVPFTFAGSTARAAVVPSLAKDPRLASASGNVAVIVRAVTGQVAAAKTKAQSYGATVGTDVTSIGAFEATMPASNVDGLLATGTVQSVTADATVQVPRSAVSTLKDKTDTSADSDLLGLTQHARYLANTNAALVRVATGADGSGIGVAVLDTGIDAGAGGNVPKKVAVSVDLSGEAKPTRDSFGHGTAMASVIAGDAEGLETLNYAGGMAPNARLISVKVAGADGSTTLGKMLEGMQWILDNRVTYNIRVLNLSWGGDATQDPLHDPLVAAVDTLWKAGVVVVVSAGNAGPTNGTITSPGDSPTVLTAGAYDDLQNILPGDDTMASFSSRGRPSGVFTKPDVVAPAVLVLSERSPGSTIATNYPKALYNSTLIRGSGTSQAAAEVSGAVALLLKYRPQLTPNQVKGLLKGTATPISGFATTDQGAGRIDVNAAATYAGKMNFTLGDPNTVNPASPTSVSVATGGLTSTWTGSRWREQDWTGSRWRDASFSGASWNEVEWSGSSWNGSAWVGPATVSGRWQGSAWVDGSWSGSPWADGYWATMRTQSGSWSGSRWRDAAWVAGTWG